MFRSQDQCKFRGSHTTVAICQRNKNPDIVARQKLISSAADVVVQGAAYVVEEETNYGPKKGHKVDTRIPAKGYPISNGSLTKALLAPE